MKASDIKRATLTGPTRFAIHTIPGFGKTTLAAEFPNPIWEAAEEGFPRDLAYEPAVLPAPEKWEDFFDHVNYLTYEPHDFQSYVLDTADWAEPFIHRYVCERDSGRKTELNKAGHKLISIEDYGFSKGYVAAEEEFRRYIDALKLMQKRRGMHVVLLMHTHIKNFKNPTGPDYDTYQPKVHSKIAAVIGEFVENFFFGFYDVSAAKLASESKAKGTSSGKRLLGTCATAAYDAKNRIDLKPVIELDDPRELVPYLLGQKVIRREWRAEPAKNDAMWRHVPPPEKMSEPERREEPRRDHVLDQRTDGDGGGPSRERAADERIARNFEQDAKRNFEPVPPEAEGKPAHHEDRRADEDRRREEAFAEQRRQNEERAAREEKQRQERGWTEPKHPSEVKTTPPPKKANRTDELLEKLTNLLVRAGEVKGPEYRAKVEKWTKNAKGDPDKIDAIIEDVQKTLNAAAPAA